MTSPETPADEPAPVPLDVLGWDERYAEQLGRVAPGGGVPGRVARADRGLVTVLTAAGPERVPLGPELHRRRHDVEHHVAVGDWVVVSEGAVVAVLPRRSAFTRGDPERAVSKVVAANLDVVLVVHSLASPLNERRLERELILVREGGAEPVVVLTKLDECPDAAAHVEAVARVAPEIAVHAVSNVTGKGFDAVRTHVGPGRTVALIGASGVGKSSMVNVLLGAEFLATGEVRAGDQRGRHTTTARQLIVLPCGGVVVDTPGLRTLALPAEGDRSRAEGSGGMGEVFHDVEEIASRCRFSDCAHEGEPGCAIAAALAEGTIDELRVAAYLTLDAEAERGVQKRGERTAPGPPKRNPEAGRRAGR